jgi:membrane protein required for colicin V production
VTTFDWVVVGIVAVSAAIGAWRGLVGEALAILAWVLALIAAWLFGASVGSALFAGVSDPALRMVAGFGAVILLVLVAMALLKLLLRKILQALGLSLTDRLLGVLFGLARGLAIVLLLVMVGGLTSAPRMSWWKAARLSPPLEIIVLAARPMLPPDLAKKIRY